MVPTRLHARLGHPVVVERAGEAEVHDEDAAGWLAHDVLWLQIAMDHTCCMSGFQRTAYLADDRDGLRGCEFSFFVQDGVEILPLDILHGDELHPICFAEVVDADDVSVSDVARKKDLLLEAVDDCRIASEFRANHF